MNSARQVEVHYINTGFPYTVTESFMDLFEGLTYTQETTYWSTNTNSYKHGMSGSSSTSHYGGNHAYEVNDYYGNSHAYEVNDYLAGVEGSRRVWDNPSVMNGDGSSPFIGQGSTVPEQVTELQTITIQVLINNPRVFQSFPRALESICSSIGATELFAGLAFTNTRDRSFYPLLDALIYASSLKSIQSRNSAVSQMVWQEGIDPDNMTYEELLDLGEVVGNHNRGLSPECISSLPVSKYKCGFLLRRKSRCERCVICQMNYKRGDRQMILPCKHAYHASCVTRWLSINKACPICYVEVYSQGRRD